MSVKLPVLSSAATTDFVSVEIGDARGRTLHLDGNQKISGWAPIANAFSLVQIEDCPMSTPTCRASCYVHGLEAAAKTTHDLYRHNSRAIRAALEDDDRGAELAAVVAWRIRDTCQETGFRWHVSGDLFSPEYATWVAQVAELSPEIQHWIYTRSFPLTAAFVGIANVSVNYSVDRDNYRNALPYFEAHRSAGSPVRLCYLVTADGEIPADLPDDSVIFPDYALRGARGTGPAEQRKTSPWYQALAGRERKMVCPVDFYSKAPGRRCGPKACSRCIVSPVAQPLHQTEP